MFFDLKVTTFKALALFYCCYGPYVSGGTKNIWNLDSIVLPYEGHRGKRQGGGGIIPFRPLFVYRQQQREQQEKWKEIEAKKKLNQQYHPYQETIKQNQHRPPTASSYSYSSKPSTNIYPSSNYESHYPSYYGRYEYEVDPVYQPLPSKNYQDYYDGYEYSYSK